MRVVAVGGPSHRLLASPPRHSPLRCLSVPEASGPFVLVDIPPPRKSTVEPSAVPVVHSPAYYLQSDEPEQNLLAEAVAEDEGETAFEENPVEWVLSTTDQILNDMEKNPTATTETIWALSNSPIGKGAAAGVRTAAKITLKAGQEAVKMAVPAGKWALKGGVSALTKILTSRKEI